MTKRLIDIDDTELDAARRALETQTNKDTISRALRLVATIDAARKDLEFLKDPSATDLSDPEVMAGAWR
jgi:Arc/MetJ family transcription regulator